MSEVDPKNRTAPGIVFLVGAGPGSRGLLTLRGAELIDSAEVLLYDGLVDDAIVALAPAGCERIYVGKKRNRHGELATQDDINDLLVDRARQGKRVVRLKGGDPFVFGRGAEECRALAEAGVSFVVVPGVTSATAVPAYAGIPLTARGVSSTVAFATGHEAEGKPVTDVDWQALSRAGTLVLFMALKTLGECTAKLIANGSDPETPAAAIYWGTTGAQRSVVSTLAGLAEAAGRAELKPPVLVVVGNTVKLREELGWFERMPLLGKRFLVTRSAADAGDLARRVVDAGGDIVPFPVTRTVALEGEDELALRRSIRGVASGDYNWIVFASANAVEYFMAAVRAEGRDARLFGGCRIACVGLVTAAALGRFGLRADVVPAHGNADQLGAELVAAAGAEPIRALFPRAVHGRDEGLDRVRAGGGRADAVAAYRTTDGVDDSEQEAGLRRLDAGEIDGIIFFAPSQVQAFFDLLGHHAVEPVRPGGCVAAIGQTTASALALRGVASVIIPERPDSESLVAALITHFEK